MSARVGRVGGGAVLAAALAAACCGGPKQPAGPGPGAGGDGDPVGQGPGPGAPDDGDDPADGPPLEERIAAIERAMNDLAPVASQCWAAAAADDLHVAGAVRMLVTIARDGHATAQATVDEPGDPVLVRCLAEVLGAYEWAPPIRGQEVELPFAFRAPAMQNVIDRRMVPHRAQAGIDVAVLLDETNTANPAASLLDVTIAADAVSGPRQIDRTELWLFASPAEVAWAGGAAAPVTVAAGDALWVPVGQRLRVAPAGGPVRAVLALVPGGREGAARAGALPGASTAIPEHGGAARLPVVLRAADGARYPRPGGQAVIRLEPGVPSKAIGKDLAVLGLTLDAGGAVPPHVHAAETELLYVLGGAGSMTVGGATVPVSEHSVIQIPPGVEHSFTATAAVTAVQLYTPAGPEQRFKKSP